jgi:predicted MFS family arabinose efflux permease
MAPPAAAPVADLTGRRWVGVAIMVSLSATVLGLSRFGYGVLLPAMRAELGWSYAQAGLLETANAVGYLAGALGLPALLARVGLPTTLRCCAAVATLSLLGCAATPDLALLLVLRGIGGAASAALFVAGALLAARLATATGRPGAVLGIYYAGVGPGILLTALLAPVVLSDPSWWRVGWLVLGGLAAGCAAVAGRVAGRIPTPADLPGSAGPRRQRLGWALVAFTLFGIGYVPYATFAPAYWRQSSSVALVTGLWVLLAGAATASGWLWRRSLARPARALAVLLAVVTTAVALPLASVARPVLAVSAALFGAAFLAVSAAATGLIRQARPEPEWSRTLTVFIALFGAGQVVGPLLTGRLADHIGLRGGLAVAAGLLTLAVLAACLQSAPDDVRGSPPAPAAAG